MGISITDFLKGRLISASAEYNSKINENDRIIIPISDDFRIVARHISHWDSNLVYMPIASYIFRGIELLDVSSATDETDTAMVDNVFNTDGSSISITDFLYKSISPYCNMEYMLNSKFSSYFDLAVETAIRELVLQYRDEGPTRFFNAELSYLIGGFSHNCHAITINTRSNWTKKPPIYFCCDDVHSKRAFPIDYDVLRTLRGEYIDKMLMFGETVNLSNLP